MELCVFKKWNQISPKFYFFSLSFFEFHHFIFIFLVNFLKKCCSDLDFFKVMFDCREM